MRPPTLTVDTDSRARLPRPERRQPWMVRRSPLWTRPSAYSCVAQAEEAATSRSRWSKTARSQSVLPRRTRRAWTSPVSAARTRRMATPRRWVKRSSEQVRFAFLAALSLVFRRSVADAVAGRQAVAATAAQMSSPTGATRRFWFRNSKTNPLLVFSWTPLNEETPFWRKTFVIQVNLF